LRIGVMGCSEIERMVSAGVKASADWTGAWDLKFAVSVPRDEPLPQASAAGVVARDGSAALVDAAGGWWSRECYIAARQHAPMASRPGELVTPRSVAASGQCPACFSRSHIEPTGWQGTLQAVLTSPHQIPTTQFRRATPRRFGAGVSGRRPKHH